MLLFSEAVALAVWTVFAGTNLTFAVSAGVPFRIGLVASWIGMVAFAVIRDSNPAPV